MTRSTIRAEFRNYRNMRQLRQFDKSTPTYWIAKIVGYTASGFKFEFVKPVVDYSQSNSKQSRGVFYYWHLADGVYCGVCDPNFARQYFLCESGVVTTIDKTRAEECINECLEKTYLMQQESE